QPARTLVGLDAFCRRPAHPDGQQPLGTPFTRAGFGAQELLRLGGSVGGWPCRGPVFHLPPAPRLAGSSSSVAPLVLAKLRRGREPGAKRHRTIPALEPV